MARKRRPRGVGAFLVICGVMLAFTIVLLTATKLLYRGPEEERRRTTAGRRQTKTTKGRQTARPTEVARAPTRTGRTGEKPKPSAKTPAKPSLLGKKAEATKAAPATKQPAPAPAKKPTTPSKKQATAPQTKGAPAQTKKAPATPAAKPAPKPTKEVARAPAPKPVPPPPKPVRPARGGVADKDFMIRVTQVRFENTLPRIPGAAKKYEAGTGQRYLVVTTQIQPLRESANEKDKSANATGAGSMASVGGKLVAMFKSTEVVLKDSGGNTFPCIGHSILANEAYLVEGDFPIRFTSKDLRAIAKELIWKVPQTVKSAQLVYRDRPPVDLTPFMK